MRACVPKRFRARFTLFPQLRSIRTMKKVYAVALATIALSLIAGLVSLYGLKLPFVTRLNTGETLLMLLFHLGICALFLMGIRSFKTEFKHAYLYICAGVLLLALAVFQYTVLGSVNALGSFWVTSGMVELPFVLSIVFMVIGFNKFAQLMGVTGLRRYLGITLGVMVVLCALSTLIPSTRPDIDHYTLFVTSILYVSQTVLLISIVPLAYRIRQKAGVLYIPLFAWMFAGFITYSVQMIVQTVALYLMPDTHWYVVYGGTTVFFVIAGACFMKAALELNRISYSEPLNENTRVSFFGRPLTAGDAVGKRSSVDAIVYLAQLASNRTAADPILDGLRTVTSNIMDNQELTVSQQAQLVTVYQRMEAYLLTEERIATYTADSLRKRVIQKYRNNSDSYFWEALTAPGTETTNTNAT